MSFLCSFCITFLDSNLCCPLLLLDSAAKHASLLFCPYKTRLNKRCYCCYILSWQEQAFVVRQHAPCRSFHHAYILWSFGCCFHVCLSHSYNKCLLMWMNIILESCNFESVSHGLLKADTKMHYVTGLPGHLWWPGSLRGLCTSQIAFQVQDLSNCSFGCPGTSAMKGEKIDSSFILPSGNHHGLLHRWYLLNKLALFYWKDSLEPTLAVDLLIVLWFIGNKNSKCMGELPPCLMQDELFLGWNLMVHFQLTAGWAEVLFLLCAHSGFSGVTQGHTGVDKLLVGVIPALPCETSLECG